MILPFLLVLALLIYLESGRPIFYKDERMGKDGKLFWCLKFRTMVSNAETLLQTMLEQDAEIREENSKYHKLREDPHVTRVGHFLRKTSLDELPQIWNVLRGAMSLVGPRPYLPRESQEIELSQNEILRVSPGITGPWQVSGRNLVFFSERVELDSRYARLVGTAGYRAPGPYRENPLVRPRSLLATVRWGLGESVQQAFPLLHELHLAHWVSGYTADILALTTYLLTRWRTASVGRLLKQEYGHDGGARGSDLWLYLSVFTTNRAGAFERSQPANPSPTDERSWVTG